MASVGSIRVEDSISNPGALSPWAKLIGRTSSQTNLNARSILSRCHCSPMKRGVKGMEHIFIFSLHQVSSAELQSACQCITMFQDDEQESPAVLERSSLETSLKEQ